MTDFVLAFVPIFIAMDPIGTLPMFLNITYGLDAHARRLAIYEAMVTALAVAIGFIFGGRLLFRLMGITVEDFMVAGGLLLFLIATLDILTTTKPSKEVHGTVGAVPLGVPLIVGPAVLTTSLMLVDVRGVGATLAAVIVNIAIAGVVLAGADLVVKVLREAGTRVVSKVAALLLAAIAVMMMRKGLTGIVTGDTVIG